MGGGQRGKEVKESKGRQAKGEKRIEGKIKWFDETLRREKGGRKKERG